jgi:ZIP family zinc transporter
MAPILLSIGTFISTLSGGLTALHHRKSIKRILGLTAGVILGVVTFDLLPEIFKIVADNHLDPTYPMIALALGFLLFHISEKYLLMHHAEEKQYGKHRHPHVGILSALALSGHSFLDGVGIGLGFQVSPAVGLAVAIAVIGHDFADGLNTVSLMLTHKNPSSRAKKLLLLDATTPVLGVLSTKLFHVSEAGLVAYLGFFAGFLLYIGASDILPQAHEDGSTRLTIGLTVIGVLFMFVVTRFA